jgi:hypothetical protein
MSNHNITIRMTAAHWDVRVRAADGNIVTFDHRHMDKKERSTFHRELMNAYRASRGTQNNA